jgi:hypothetical protein
MDSNGSIHMEIARLMLIETWNREKSDEGWFHRTGSNGSGDGGISSKGEA